jgi:hypothetical protein
MIDIVVSQGTVHVNSISVMHESDEHVVYHIDTSTKRPDIEATSTKCIFIGPGENIPSEDYEVTTVLFDVPDGWYKVCQVGKYHIDVALYKRIEHSEDAVVWSDVA